MPKEHSGTICDSEWVLGRELRAALECRGSGQVEVPLVGRDPVRCHVLSLSSAMGCQMKLDRWCCLSKHYVIQDGAG